MKKIIIFIILFMPVNIYALDKVTLSKCVDGDTARFILNKEEIKVRFLGIDAPEIEKNNQAAEPYGNEAANYTCRKLKNAKSITLEYDQKTEKKDKYDRYLAYVFVDGKLLEEQILKNGYANVKYINSSYKYYNELNNAELKAINNKKGMYSKQEYTEEKLEKDLAKIIKKYCKKLFSNILREIFN